MVTDQLYHPDDQYLPLDEVIRRIAPAFRRVHLDRARGDAGVREGYEQLLAVGAPNALREAQLAQLGTTVCASVADNDGPDGWIEFVLTGEDLLIEYRLEADRERLRPTVSKLAGLLGYQINVWN